MLSHFGVILFEETNAIFGTMANSWLPKKFDEKIEIAGCISICSNSNFAPVIFVINSFISLLSLLNRNFNSISMSGLFYIALTKMSSFKDTTLSQLNVAKQITI